MVFHLLLKAVLSLDLERFLKHQKGRLVLVDLAGLLPGLLGDLDLLEVFLVEVDLHLELLMTISALIAS